MTMYVDPAVSLAQARVLSRQADADNAYRPGARARNDDVARTHAASRPMLDPLSVVAPADAYFLTNGSDGRRSYTRDGSLAVHDGRLVDGSGRPVLGTVGGEPMPQELRIDPVDAALGRARDLRIEADGHLVYDRRVVEPRTGATAQQRVVVGRILLARFPAGTRLEPVDASHGGAPVGIVPHVGRPGDGNFGSLEPFARDEGGIDTDRSLDRLRQAYLALDAMRAAQVARAGVSKTAIDLLK
ncbi:MAG: flagellar hook-basal body protein [Vulcanimicrobiaceae bacterium]